MAGHKHLIAVNRTVAGAGLHVRGEHAAIVEMARNLARRMDATGSDDAPLSLVRSFQSALKDLQRAAAATAAIAGAEMGLKLARDDRPVEDFDALPRLDDLQLFGLRRSVPYDVRAAWSAEYRAAIDAESERRLEAFRVDPVAERQAERDRVAAQRERS